MREISDSFVDSVEDILGMEHGAWDMLDPKEICRAVLLAASRPEDKAWITFDSEAGE